MSWLSEFNHHNSWALPVELGVGALAGGLLAGPALGALGGFAGEAAGGLGGLFGAAGAESGAGGLAALGGAEAGGAAGGLGVEGLDALAFAAPEGANAFGAPGGAPGAGGTFASPTPGSIGGNAALNAPNSLDSLVGGAGGTGTAAAPGGNAASGGGSLLDKLVTGAENSLVKDPLKTLGSVASGGALALNLAQGSKKDPNLTALQTTANQLSAQGQQLQQYLQSGTLPPGLQTAIDQAKAAAKARIVSNHAANGMSADPSQNSALAQELNAVDLNATALVAQQAEQLLTAGTNEVGLSGQLYKQLVDLDRQQSTNVGKAIMNFASALNGAPNKTTA